MSAAALWARAHIRRRLLGLVAVALLAGLGGGAAIAAAAGARRAATAYDRHLDATRSPTVIVNPRGENPYGRDAALGQFADLPGIAASGRLDTYLMRPAGTDFHIFLDNWIFAPRDARLGVDVARFRIIDGRPFDHSRADEAVVTEQWADRVGVEVGDTVRLESWTEATRDATERGEIVGTPAPDGPDVQVTVVGITRGFGVIETYAAEGVYLTEAFTRRWEGRISTFIPVLLLRLHGGLDGFPAFETAARELADELGGDWDIDANDARAAEVSGAIDAQRFALMIFSVVTGGAALVVVYSALARQLSFAAVDQGALRALGMTKGARVVGVVLLAAPTAVVGAMTAVGLAYASSGLLPIGTPGDLEPAPGLRADAVVFGVGGLAVLAAVLALAALAGTAVTRVRTVPAVETRGRLAALAATGWLPRPASIGVHFAVERGRGSRALPTRSTLAGCAVGVGGAVAALVFSAGLTQLTSTPRLYGWAADAVAGVGADPEAWREAGRQLEMDPRVEDIAAFVNIDVRINGRIHNGLLYDLVRGDPLTVVVSGRTPRTRDEIALGRAVSDRLDVGTGDVASLSLADGTTRDLTVVGIVAMPGVVVPYREQVAMLGDDFREYEALDNQPWHGFAVTFTGNADAAAVVAEYRAAGLTVVEPRRPRAISNLDEVDVVPAILATVLGTLGLAFLAHALATGVRRRGPELAVLKALGFSRGQLRSVVATQATTVAVFGVCLGVPAGLVLGRAAWSLVAHRFGVPLELTALWPALLVALGVVVVANAVAFPPGRRASRVDPASQLRAP